MRLSWEVGYEDYNDTLNWNRRYRELREVFSSLDVEGMRYEEEEKFLNCMENLEELMRFYTSQQDFAHLQPVMDAYEKLLAIGEERVISHVGFYYLKMIFSRIRAIIYRAKGDNEKSASYYRDFLQNAQVCFVRMKKDSSLSKKQMLYVGWACIEGAGEAARVHDSLMDVKNYVKYSLFLYNVVQWLDDNLYEAYGIAEKVSELCSQIGAYLYQLGEQETAEKCFKKAIEIFEELDERCHLDYYAARALWIRSQHSLLEFSAKSNAASMLKCESDTESFMRYRAKMKSDLAIASGIMGIMNLQRSVMLQMASKMKEAIAAGEKSCQYLDSSLCDLENEYRTSSSYKSVILKDMAAKVFSNYISALDTVGVQYFQNSQNAQAKDKFKRAITLLDGNKDYNMAGSGILILRAEVSLYLGLICSEEGDVNKASEYAMKAADYSYEVCTNTKIQNVLELAVTSCSFAAEMLLALKKKPVALRYAELGLEVCDILVRVAPQSERLQMRALIENYRKKAKRKFF